MSNSEIPDYLISSANLSYTDYKKLIIENSIDGESIIAEFEEYVRGFNAKIPYGHKKLSSYELLEYIKSRQKTKQNWQSKTSLLRMRLIAYIIDEFINRQNKGFGLGILGDHYFYSAKGWCHYQFTNVIEEYKQIVILATQYEAKRTITGKMCLKAKDERKTFFPGELSTPELLFIADAIDSEKQRTEYH
ncbi:MAG: hypothetical protein JJU00_10400 [Opitutales bacterium]|nr:hypothetical protein [Opitutales bacterium]